MKSGANRLTAVRKPTCKKQVVNDKAIVMLTQRT